MVALEGVAGAVRLAGVEFDAEAELRPVDVDLVADLVPAGRGTRQAGGDEVLDESPLELRAGRRRRLVDRQRVAQALRAVVPAVALDHRVDRVEVEQPELFGAGRGPARSWSAAQLPRQVEQRPRDRGDRDPVDHRPVLLDQVPRPVPTDPFRRRMVPRHERRDLERLRRAPPDPPQPPGRVVAEQRPRSHRQHRRQAFARAARAPCARPRRRRDRSDAAARQPTARSTACCEKPSRCFELPDRNDTVLPSQQAPPAVRPPAVDLVRPSRAVVLCR